MPRFCAVSLRIVGGFSVLFYSMLGMGVAAEVAVTFSVCSWFYSVRSGASTLECVLQDVLAGGTLRVAGLLFLVLLASEPSCASGDPNRAELVGIVSSCFSCASLEFAVYWSCPTPTTNHQQPATSNNNQQQPTSTNNNTQQNTTTPDINQQQPTTTITTTTNLHIVQFQYGLEFLRLSYS